jgi:putative ABC transport system substrate-binding protein
VRRRAFITLLGGAAAAWPLAARPQQPAMPVIGYFSGRSPDAEAPLRVPFLKALEELGFAAGRNFALEYRFAEGHDERLPMLAAELVRQQVAMLVATDRHSAVAAKAATATIPIVFTSGFGPAVMAAKAATATIPIVFQAGIDPVKVGLVASLNRPGGNITGVSNVSSALAAKRLELLHRLAPDAATIGVLVDPTNSAATDIQTADLQEAASGLGLQLMLLNASNEHEIDAAFAKLMQGRVGALLLIWSP